MTGTDGTGRLAVLRERAFALLFSAQLITTIEKKARQHQEMLPMLRLRLGQFLFAKDRQRDAFLLCQFLGCIVHLILRNTTGNAVGLHP